MDSTLIASLKSIHDASLHWEQGPVIIHEGFQVQLCHASGKNASTLPNAPNQPGFLPQKLQALFENKTCKGIDAAPAMEKLVKSFCSGCKLYNQKRGTITCIP